MADAPPLPDAAWWPLTWLPEDENHYARTTKLHVGHKDGPLIVVDFVDEGELVELHRYRISQWIPDDGRFDFKWWEDCDTLLELRCALLALAGLPTGVSDEGS